MTATSLSDTQLRCRLAPATTLLAEPGTEGQGQSLAQSEGEGQGKGRGR